MKPLDFGRSDDPRVQAQLDRLSALSVPQGRLGLDTIRALLERLGSPHRKLPPVFHVAGTNGKGSTCAFLRAMLEAGGYRVHVTTSPHLVRYNERIRLASELISDGMLADVLEEVLDASEQGGEDLGPSFFEVTIAAAFLAFSRTPADVCVVEVGMGGRFDATNVLEPEALAACGIAALGLDHERFLLAPEEGVPTEPMARIAFEKAGIAKQGVPLVTMGWQYGSDERMAINAVTRRVGARHLEFGVEWTARTDSEGLLYRDDYGQVDFAHPSLAGAHQASNAALAIAMLRHQDRLAVGEEAMKAGLKAARWPARLQRLQQGRIIGSREVWLDGGHNRQCGEALAQHFLGRELHLIIGTRANRPPDALTGPLTRSLVSITAVPVPGHEHHPPHAIGPNVIEAADVPTALAALPDDGLPVLIAGSLYLAGEVLRLNDELPD